MSFKKVLLLGGTALLMAACNSGVTAPVGAVRGGAASQARAAADSTKRTIAPAATTSSFGDDCWSSYPVSSGFIDSTCLINP